MNNKDTTKIVGHRGAGHLELENTIRSFKRAKELGVDAIELDVLATKDGKFVVCHDNNLKRLSGTDQHIDGLTYAELSDIHLRNTETIPLLYDVLELIDGIPVILDIKTDKFLPELFALLGRFPDMEFTIVTHLKHVVRICKSLRPDIPAFIGRHYTPLGLMRSITKYGADGLNLNFIWLNPFTYRAARKKGMQIQVYTVDNLLIAQLLKKLYPGIWICTNNPQKFLDGLRTSGTTPRNQSAA